MIKNALINFRHSAFQELVLTKKIITIIILLENLYSAISGNLSPTWTFYTSKK